MRALEVYELSGKTITELQAIKPKPLPYIFTEFSLMPQDRHVLHERIAQRFDLMLANNFEQEVAKLRTNTALHIELPAIRSVGYRQMWLYLAGEYGTGKAAWEIMREKGIIATRQLAKRQITWLRSWSDAVELETGNVDNINAVMRRIR
jgi:tRNA dimethylallyltransferase